MVRPVGIPRENFALVFGPPSIPDKEKKKKKKKKKECGRRAAFDNPTITDASARWANVVARCVTESLRSSIYQDLDGVRTSDDQAHRSNLRASAPFPADLFDETSMETPIVNDRSMECGGIPREACSGAVFDGAQGPSVAAFSCPGVWRVAR